MKKLLLLRHAKSSWDDPGLADFDRPLNERGRRAAPLMGKFLRNENIGIDLILCSPAQRTRQTIALVTKAARLDAPLRFDERIYEATLDTLVEVVSQIEESAVSVMLVGHNPGLEQLLFYLTGEDERMPTGALAELALDVEKWSKTHEGCAQLERFTRPRQLDKE